MPNISPHHIIAIGASAGGLEELNIFFDHTPVDGVSYVIVQHLSSDFKSRMVELLSRHSKLVVQEAEDGMEVLCNQVYLIPNDKFLTIHGQRLYLGEKTDERAPYLTINKFFISLAGDCGPKAIGVILSGLGSDGSDGVKAIKKAGGIVIARDPHSSEFSSMPSNAIATGMVDFILEPQDMPAAIEDYVKRELDLMASNISDEQNVSEIIGLINEHLPFDFSEYKQSTVLRRIKRRAAYHNLGTLKSYYDFAKNDPAEIEILAKDFLISVTAFFRDTGAFEVIEKEVLPAIIAGLEPGQEVRMWVTGCATGEEAYSISMLLCEQLGEKLGEHPVKIFATDIDSTALAHASTGSYSLSVAKGVSAERLERFFILEDRQYRVKMELRKMLIFAQHDLVKNPPYCNMHLISCRNMLIYMTPVLQKKIYLLMLFGLRQNGYLFLGSSENPTPILPSVAIIDKKWKIYQNLEASRAVRFDAFSLPHIGYNKTAGGIATQEGTFKNTDRTLGDAINETLTRDMAGLMICIDQNYKILKSYGDTSRFLLQKIMTLDLTELLPGALTVVFKSVISKVISSREASSVTGIKITLGEDVLEVNLQISPVIFKDRPTGLYLVRFNETGLSGPQKAADLVFDESLYFNNYTESLEKEISECREKLLASEEKLFALNENMQSFNEELLSANEEMQSTNEEMQSVNEELHTINSDYQLKNKELQELNDDLNNYFRSNINGQLFVDRELRLMKFSPGAVRLINLRESDIGRPLANISTNFKLETIFEDIKQVLSNNKVVTREIEANDDSWYQIMTMPYIRQADQQTSGLIITFNDITELKKVQQQLDKKNDMLMRINEDLDNFVHTASHDLLAPLGNIEGSISLLNEMESTHPELSELLPIINSSVKKFRNLIKQIAVVAKIENDALVTETVDLDELLDDIEWSLSDRIKATGASIHRNLKVNEVNFSKKNLRSILFNLISNGIKYKADRLPVIDVETSVDTEGITLSVSDNGIGMQKQDIGKIFDKYSRLKTEVEGYGIGLYLTKRIVVASGGRVEVESVQGKGSRFCIRLPQESIR
jgi:two-component system CheB/CheR fusion protein